jgi:hypothetical protein
VGGKGLSAVNHQEGMSREERSERLERGTCVASRRSNFLSTKVWVMSKHCGYSPVYIFPIEVVIRAQAGVMLGA